MPRKVITIIFLLALVVVGAYWFISNEMIKVGDGKPRGPYHSSESIQESKNSGVWIGSYLTDREYYKSSDGTDTYAFKEIWIEQNTNDPKLFPEKSGFDWILNLYFNKVTENDLHKFRLIGTSNDQSEYPDGYPRIRFLLKELSDTIRLEVIERNPKDSLAWLTEKVVDTVVLYKKPPMNIYLRSWVRPDW